MPKLTILYKLSEQGRKKSLLNGGDGKEKQVIITDFTERFSKYSTVNVSGEAELEVRKTKHSVSSFNKLPSIYCNITSDVHFDDIQTAESILKFMDENYECPPSKEILDELEKETELWNERQERLKELKRQEEKRRLEEEERKQKEKEKIESLRKEKEQWIKKHGSEYLALAYDEGYNCQRLYVEERSKYEIPGFTIDFDDEISIKDRSLPTKEALSESLKYQSKGHDCKVYWDSFNEQEILGIKEYLGKYWAFKYM